MKMGCCVAGRSNVTHCFLQLQYNTHLHTKHCCFILNSVGQEASDCSLIFTLMWNVCYDTCQKNPGWHRVAQVLTVWHSAHVHSDHDITAEVFPLVWIQQGWTTFKAACVFCLSEWFIWHVGLLFLSRARREGIYCRWQWIRRSGAPFTFTITMVIDSFETCWVIKELR